MLIDLWDINRAHSYLMAAESPNFSQSEHCKLFCGCLPRDAPRTRTLAAWRGLCRIADADWIGTTILAWRVFRCRLADHPLWA